MKTCIVILCLFMLTGCASLKFKSKDAEVSYFRLFTSASKVEAQVGDAELKMNGQKIDTKALQGILTILGQ